MSCIQGKGEEKDENQISVTASHRPSLRSLTPLDRFFLYLSSFSHSVVILGLFSVVVVVLFLLLVFKAFPHLVLSSPRSFFLPFLSPSVESIQ